MAIHRPVLGDLDAERRLHVLNVGVIVKNEGRELVMGLGNEDEKIAHVVKGQIWEILAEPSEPVLAAGAFAVPLHPSIGHPATLPIDRAVVLFVLPLLS